MLLKILFWIVVAIDLAAIGLLYVLGLAAAGPSHTSPLEVTALLLVLPCAVLTVAAALFLAAKSLLWRTIAFLIAASPILVTVVSIAIAGVDASRYRDKNGSITFFSPGPMQELEAAIAKNDAAAVAVLAPTANLSQKARDGSTVLVLALRQLEKNGGPPVILETLLQAGANPNTAQMELPLSVAIQISRKAGIEPLRLLLKAKADPNARTQFGPPVFFSGTGLGVDQQVLPLLLDNGANLTLKSTDGRDVLVDAANAQNWKAVLMLLQRGADWKQSRNLMGKDFLEMVESDIRNFGKSPDKTAVIQFLR
jgi:ankyrin repeat protein